MSQSSDHTPALPAPAPPGPLTVFQPPVHGDASGDPHVADALHRLLVASVQDYAIYALDRAGRVATWNPGAERLKGYTRDEILGQPISRFYPPESRDVDGVPLRAQELLETAARDGRAETEGWRVRKDGSQFWAHVAVTPVRDEQGALIGFAKVTRDLTERRAAEARARELAAEQAARSVAERAEAEARLLAERLQEQALELEAQTEEAQVLTEELEQTNAELQQTALEAERARDAADAARRAADELQARFRRLFEASPLPSWAVDLETLAILDVNEAAVRRYGYDREEFAALTLRELRDHASLADLPTMIVRAATDGEYHGVTQHRTKSGECLDVELTARSIEHGGRPAMVVVLADVTERLRAEARQRFLVDATAMLAESLDHDAILRRLVKLAVPTLADWAAYNTIDGAHIRTAAIHHPDPAMERLAREIDARYPMRADAPAGVAQVIATGEPQLIPDIPDEVLRAVAHDEPHYEQLKAIGFRSLINVPLLARGRVLGALGFATGESGRRFTDEDLAFAVELGRRAGLALDNALHVQAERDARARAEQGVERLRRLERLATALSREFDIEAVSRLVVREVRAAVGADAAYVARALPFDGALELVHGEGFPISMEGIRQRFSLDLPVPGAYVVRTREAMWLASPEDRAARFGHLDESPVTRSFGASATLPLVAAGEALGSLGVYFAEPRAFAPEDQAYLSALAEQVALTLDRVRLFEAERRARQIAERLQGVTAALSEAVTPADVTRIVIGQGLAALGAGAGFVATLLADDDGEAVLEIGDAVGYDPAELAAARRLRLDATMPVTDAARAAAPVWLSSVAEAAERYPAFDLAAADAGRRSWAALPLVANGVTLGVIGLSFVAERVIPADERALMETLAAQCAQALERARLYEAERQARAAAAAAQARAEFLAEASRVLSSSLQYAETLESVARSAVPRLGDWCAVDMVTDPGAGAWPPTVQRLAVMHQDPAKIAWARELQERQPTDWTAPTGLPRVLREGVTEFLPVITDALLVAAATSEEQLALMREIGFSAYLCVPLRVRRRVVGAITLCMTESGRHYDDADRALAEELAHRASLAIEHAELYREAQAASAAKTRFLAVMSHELRTPLNAIGGYVDLLEMEVRGPVTAEQRTDLLRVRRSQRHLLHLINDVLDFARIEAGQAQVRVEDVPIGEALEAAVTLVAPQAAVKEQALDLEANIVAAARADREKVEQILVNLLSNAVKFTADRGRITVRCSAAGDRVEVRVADTGIGIPADRLASVFEPFVQVQSGLTRPVEGTGLGLAISRDLARGMGGDLTVESTLGAGSTFTLTLPRA